MRTIKILMSTYNGEKYLDKQLASIEQQCLPDDIVLKILARDDGSKDNTLQILKKWKTRLNIEIVEGDNNGARQSFYWLLMNSGKSDYFAFCDQDDIWKKNKLEKSIKKLDEGFDLYFSNLEYMDTEDKPLGKYLLRDNFELSLKRVFMCNPANGCTMVWNKLLNDKVRTINYDTYTMHDEFICTVAETYFKVYYDRDASMYYRLHQDNVTQSNGFIKKFKIWKNVWFGRSKYQIDMRARELLYGELNNEKRALLEEIARYKIGLNRFRMVNKFSCEDQRIQRSFKLRIILKII